MVIPDVFLKARAWPLHGILLFCYIATVFSNWPGHYSVDSIVQLFEGETNYYYSLQPPLMSKLLGILTVQMGHGAFIALNSFLFYLAIHLLVHSYQLKSNLLRCFLLAAICLNPVVLIYNGIVWKDVFFANLALLGFSIASLINSARRWPLVLSLACYAWAALIRQNGLVVSVMGLALIALRLQPSPVKPSRMARDFALLCIGLLVVVIATRSWVVSTQIKKTPGEYAMGTVVVLRYDIAGIVAGKGVASAAILSAHGVDPKAAISRAKEVYTPLRLDTLNSFNRTIPEKVIGSLWTDLVSAFPMAYLAHKWRVWAALVAPESVKLCLPFHVGIASETLDILRQLNVPFHFPDGFLPEASSYSSTLFRYGSSASFLFYNWFWLGMALLLLIAGIWRGEMTVAVMAGAAVLFSLSFFAIGVACDFRYLYFTVISSLVSSLLLTSKRSGKQVDGSGP